MNSSYYQVVPESQFYGHVSFLDTFFIIKVKQASFQSYNKFNQCKRNVNQLRTACSKFVVITVV